jgi:hypothetical protein
MATCMTKSLCAAASVLLCGALAVPLYNLVAWKGLGGKGDNDDDEPAPVSNSGTIQHDGRGFRMVENINLPKLESSLLSVLAFLVGAAIICGGVWCGYKKYRDLTEN